tara:strand:+ start:33034 stop:33600 length:567 start_codon:yes stop_codon:yes gene_type:complete
MPKITDKKTGKVRRFRYTKGGHDEYKRALRERIASIAPVVGAVGAQRAIFKRQGDTKDAAATATRGGASTLTRTTGLQTKAQQQALALKQRQQDMQGRGYTGSNPTARRVRTAAGITASTEMNSYKRIYNILTEVKSPAAHSVDVFHKKLGDAGPGETGRADIATKASDEAKKRRKKRLKALQLRREV